MITPSITNDNPNYNEINEICIQALVNLSNGQTDEKAFNEIAEKIRELTGISYLRVDKFLVKLLMGLSMLQATTKLFFKDMETLQKAEKRTLIEAMSTY